MIKVGTLTWRKNMKRQVPILKAVAAFFFMTVALFAQASRPNVAVYVQGNPPNRAVLQAAFSDALVNSGKYNVIAVDAIETVIKEHKRQMGGSVRESEIAKVGEDAGAAFILVVERVDAGAGSYYISAKMVSVERKIAVMSGMSERVSDGDDIADVINTQVAVMLKMPKPIPKNVVVRKDGKVYRTTRVGGRLWMAENLNAKVGNSWCYDDKDSNCVKYGRLYDWQTALAVCPVGWRLPTRAEWDDLVKSAGGDERGGKSLKSNAVWNGADDYGWGALPAGQRLPGGTFNSLGDIGAWWSSDESDGGSAYARYINAGRSGIYESAAKKGTGHSVRCVPE